MEQGSQEWFAARCGHVTASRIADVMAQIKTGEAAARSDYRADLVAERLTGQPQESYSNAAMQWGVEQEPIARSAYEVERGEMVEQVGFIIHPSIKWSGASPDGLVGDDGLVEIKCPNTKTHIEYSVTGKIPRKYILQMQWQMECTGRKWCDFVSYDPRMPEGMRLWIKRVDRDYETIQNIKQEVIAFLDGVQQAIDKLNLIYGVANHG